jgi:hypothetical protein
VLGNHSNREVALLYWNPRLSEGDMARLVREPRIRFNIVLHDQMPATLKALLPRRTRVEARDHFHALPRNAEYAGTEFFSDSHLTFRPDSVGYGDYLTIGSIFRKGGGPAHAVAIHAVYKQQRTNQVWVEHFVSDDIDIEVGTVGEKFLQAARKLVRAVSRRRAEFGNNAALTAFADCVRTNHFPGLGVSKQLQIYHQIALNHQILRGEI